MRASYGLTVMRAWELSRERAVFFRWKLNHRSTADESWKKEKFIHQRLESTPPESNPPLKSLHNNGMQEKSSRAGWSSEVLPPPRPAPNTRRLFLRCLGERPIRPRALCGPSVLREISAEEVLRQAGNSPAS